MKMDKNRTSFTNVLAMTVMILCFTVEVVIYFNSSKDASNMAIQIISSCIALQGVVAGYFFVSSKQSALKDETIKSMQEKVNSDTTVKADVVKAENIEVVNTQTTELPK